MTGIRIDRLLKQWGTVRAVNEVSFTVDDGSLTVLLGPSGCGKSTILRLIAGLESVDGGQVFIDGIDVTRLDPARRSVSMVFQSYALFPHLDVCENILFGLKVRRVDPAEREKRLMEAATMVGLDALLDRKPAQLSGGQRQRVALARTIVSKQPVCLMDEPLSNLDAKLRAEMRDEIHRLQRELHLTMVYVTHDQTEAMSMADQVVLLKEGQIEQIGEPARLYEYPETTFAAQFLGTPPMNVMPATPHDGASLIGIRPEKLRLAGQGMPVAVSAVDYMGAETVLRLSCERGQIMARMEGRVDAKPGDRLHVDWDRDDVHRFDENGRRLGDE